MKSYEVCLEDCVVNTGVDCERFATEKEAQDAASVINDEYPKAKAAVVPVDGMPATITYDEWHARPWG